MTPTRRVWRSRSLLFSTFQIMPVLAARSSPEGDGAPKSGPRKGSSLEGAYRQPGGTSLRDELDYGPRDATGAPCSRRYLTRAIYYYRQRGRQAAHRSDEEAGRSARLNDAA